MSKVTAKEIREQLKRYLAGDLQPAEFRNWFAVALRDVHGSSDASAELLAHEIEWTFCDVEHGASSAQARETLTRLAEQNGNILVFSRSMVYGDASSSSFQTGVASGSLGRPQRLHEMAPV